MFSLLAFNFAVLQTIFLGLCLIVLGLVIFSNGRRNVIKAKKTTKWPFVVGQITVSHVVSYTAFSWAGRFPVPYRVFTPIIEYKYQIGDKSYRSTQIAIDCKLQHKEYIVAEAYTIKYSAGRRLPVHYDFDDPYDAVLEPGNTKFARNNTWLGAGIAIGGLTLVLAAFVPKPEPEPDPKQSPSMEICR